MKNLRSKLPAVSGLVAFEAAARHMNFTRAAQEMRVTQAAVSRQMRTLEGYLGVQLFRRLNRTLALTDKGHKLHRAVSIGLDHIAMAVEEIRHRENASQVAITTTIALASLWLMPKIAKFRAGNPSIDLKVVASDTVLDLAAERIDVAVRYGDGHWPGVDAKRLFEIEMFPVCSQMYLRSRRHLTSPSDLLHETLLHMDDPINSSDADWAVWMHAVGLDPPPLTGGLRFNNYPLLIQAALNSQGIALGWGHLIDDLLESGALVRAIGTTHYLEPAFYLAVPTDVPVRPEVEVFCNWILSETAAIRSATDNARRDALAK